MIIGAEPDASSKLIISCFYLTLEYKNSPAPHQPIKIRLMEWIRVSLVGTYPTHKSYCYMIICRTISTKVNISVLTNTKNYICGCVATLVRKWMIHLQIRHLSKVSFCYLPHLSVLMTHGDISRFIHVPRGEGGGFTSPLNKIFKIFIKQTSVNSILQPRQLI